MRNRRKRKQREEVRKILAAMRLELAAQRLAREKELAVDSGVRLDQLIIRSQAIAQL